MCARIAVVSLACVALLGVPISGSTAAPASVPTITSSADSVGDMIGRRPCITCWKHL
ncbi:MAG: hypothetical protein M3Y71_15620 [Actinomycetota bacterium]|nr:hypothetical protein [Actinomycetota bacterium]